MFSNLWFIRLTILIIGLISKIRDIIGGYYSLSITKCSEIRGQLE